MIFSEGVLIEIIISVLGLCGFVISRYIYKHKKENKNPLVCPVGFDCHFVVHSNYSRFLGIPVEILGMMYYLVVFFLYALLTFMPDLLHDTAAQAASYISLAAFLFSAYLISVQIFILKKGCSWCIVSSVISAFIFFLTLVI